MSVDNQPQEPALFVDGKPANRPAAAMDALEWCEWLYTFAEKRLIFSQPDSLSRLGACIEELRKRLEPHLPERREKSPHLKRKTES